MVKRLLTAAVLTLCVWGWGAGASWAGTPEGPAAEKHEAQGAAELNPINFHGINGLGDLTIWTGVVFLVVLGILWKAAWGPIRQGLEKRETELEAQFRQAQAQNEEARRLLAEHEQRLAAAQEEVRAIHEEGRRNAEALAHEIRAKAKADAESERRRSAEQIEAATQAAIEELARRSAEMAVDLAGKILRNGLKPKDHDRLIREAVAQFTSRATGNN